MSERAAEHNYRMALMFYRTERYEDAIAILDDLALEFPDSKHVVYTLTKCFFKVGRFQEARELCQELITKHNDERAVILLERIGNRKDTYKPPPETHETPPDLPVGAGANGENEHDSPSGVPSPPDDTTSSWMSSTPTGLFSTPASGKEQSSGGSYSSPPTEHPSPFTTPPPLPQESSETTFITPPPLEKEKEAEEQKKQPAADTLEKSSSTSRNMIMAAVILGAAVFLLWLVFAPHQFLFPEDHSLGTIVVREIDGSKVKWKDYDEARGQVSVPKRTYLGLKASKNLTEADFILLGKVSWLKYLDLSQSEITNDMVEYLAELRQLQTMDVRGTGLTQAGIRRLREWLPNCKVLFDVSASAKAVDTKPDPPPPKPA
ncbi:MAG: tetratricopeptide repeat protein, partial [Candidatus Hydrogenedentes bacterium]|nr:tetratricopeptide repeat protein [Candidatus Hydrogenedentota bacterium]